MSRETPTNLSESNQSLCILSPSEREIDGDNVEKFVKSIFVRIEKCDDGLTC